MTPGRLPWLGGWSTRPDCARELRPQLRAKWPQGLRGTRVGEASNPGPPAIRVLPPGGYGWRSMGNLEPGVGGWLLVSKPQWREDDSVLTVEPAQGGARVTFSVRGSKHLYRHLDPEGTFLLAGGKGPIRTWEGGQIFAVGFVSTGPAVIPIRRIEGPRAWATGGPEERDGWTYADLACGVGGFAVAAHALGGRRVWACDTDATAAC